MDTRVVSERGRFRQAGIPSALADEIAQFSEEYPWLGYRSLSNFVTSGARMLLQETRMEVWRKQMLESDGPPRELPAEKPPKSLLNNHRRE